MVPDKIKPNQLFVDPEGLTVTYTYINKNTGRVTKAKFGYDFIKELIRDHLIEIDAMEDSRKKMGLY